MKFEQWNGFVGKKWQNEVNVRQFIQDNYTPYEGDSSFLKGPTARTNELMAKFNDLLAKEAANGGVLDVDTVTVSSINNYAPGYLDKENELIVGLQTDAPLRRGVNPFGGIRMVRSACKAYGYELSDEVENEFKYRTTHNEGVFRVYTDEMKKARHIGIMTGLPDAYGRGRIIGDYRRVALYGIDFLIEQKKIDKAKAGENLMNSDNIRLCEELCQQKQPLLF